MFSAFWFHCWFLCDDNLQPWGSFASPAVEAVLIPLALLRVLAALGSLLAHFLLRLAGLLRQVTGRLGVDLLQPTGLRLTVAVTVAADAFRSAFRGPASG